MTLLQTQNLCSFYGDFQALFEINVTVEEGETIAIIGANGAGKTTLLRTLAGSLVTPPESVVFDGEPIRRWPDFASLRFLHRHRGGFNKT